MAAKLCNSVKEAIKQAMNDANCQRAGACVVVYDGQRYGYEVGESARGSNEAVMKLIKKTAQSGWSPVPVKKG